MRTEITNSAPSPVQFRLGIQKIDGRLYDASAKCLRRWSIDISSVYDRRGRHELLTVPSPWGLISLLTCRLEDVIANVADGLLDIGIVSSDVFEKWKRSEDEALRRPAITHVHDLGPAGSSLMFGVRANFMNRETATWVQAFKHGHRRKVPIVTSSRGTLEKFLKRQKLDFDPRNILERSGTVEAQGVLVGTPLICDLVGSGESMRKHGYEPVPNVEVAESRILLIGTPSRQSTRRRVFGEFWQAAKAKS